MSSPQEFYTAFQAARTAITTRLDVSEQMDSGRIAQIAQDIQIERKKLNDATSFLPAYDRRSCESQLQELEARIDAMRSKNAPAKGKFAFKKTTASAAATPPATSSKEDSIPTLSEASEQPELKPTPNLRISSTSYQCFTSTSFSQQATSSSSDLTIANLDHCVVDLLPQDPLAEGDDLSLTAVHIRDIKDSILLLGHVHGSILAHNLERCVVVVACHQLRVHSSHNTRFHLHVSSNAVIEDCSSLTFAPYPESLPLPPDVRQQKSTHHAVQDFSHLKNTPSPHWSALPDFTPTDPDRVSESTAGLAEKDASAWWSAIRSSTRKAQTASGQGQKERESLLTPVFAKMLPQAQ